MFKTPSILQLVILALMLSTPILYLKASLSEGLGFSGLGLISTGDMGRDRSRVFSNSAYMILVDGDTVSFDVSVAVTGAIYRWSLNLTIVDLIYGDRWDYSEVFYHARVPTPEFIAPRSSVYFYTLNVKVDVLELTGDRARYNVNIKISGSQGERRDIVIRLLLELPILIALLIALTITSKFKPMGSLAYKGFLGLIRWELRSLWVYTMFAVMLLAYTLVLVNFNSRIGRFPVLLGPVAFSNVVDFTVIYVILTQITTIVLYAYKWETGHERTMDLLSDSRLSRFIAKIIALILVTLVPVVIATLNTYLLWIPEVITRRPGLLIELISAQTLFVTLLTLFSISVALFFSTLIPVTSLATLLSITTTLVLYVDNPLKSMLGFDLKRVIELGDPFRGGRPVGEILYVNTETIISLIAPSMVLLAISTLLYARRENP